MITYFSELPETPIVITDSRPHVLVFVNCSGEITVDLQKPGAKAYIRALYYLKGADSHSLKTYQLHTARDTTSDLLVKAVLDGESSFAYEGTIGIPPHSHGSNAYQKNQNLLLSAAAVVDTKPYLEIAANDVRCTHGATSGPLSNEAIWYLRTRGITASAATELLIQGFVYDLYQGLEGVVESDERDGLQKVLSAVMFHD
ncbi:MAG: FeS cluster assembly protein SufD [Microgenomates bacterium OLB22]|nr:MAG: FeS cluster assembly protein SufD [Microgenomates bacterium OLB22]